MEGSEKMAERYTGINKKIKSQFIQTIMNKLDDGTLSESIDDWKWIFSFSIKYKWIILAYTLFGIGSSTLSLGASVVSKYLIDIVTKQQTDKLLLLILMQIFSTIFTLVFSSAVSRLSTKISIYVNNDIQSMIFDKIIDASYMDINQFSNGDLLNRFNNDVSTISSNAVNWLPNLIISLYTFIVTFCVLFYYDPYMALIAFVSAPFLLILSRYIMRKLKAYRKKVMEMNSSMMSFETEVFYNFDTIKSFGITDHYSKELKSWQQKYKEYNLEYNLFHIQSNIMMTMVSSLVASIAFFYCLWRLWTNQITYGTMSLFLSQRSQLSSNFSSLVSIIPNMLNSSVSAHRIRELVELPKEIHNAKAYEEMKKIADEGISVELHDVTFEYEPGKTVIQESNFVADPNEIIALVGPSGQGKTTILRLILGLIYPKEGTMVLKGKDGKEVEMNADLRKLFSYVPQGNTIMLGSIADNLRMVKEDATDDEIIEALKMSCAYEFVSKIQGGINGKLGEKGKGVSEGQAQRIAIARAILRDSPILLLDEATAALDIDTEREVLHRIIHQKANKTCIVSTHRPSILNMCQRIYRIVDGRIVELNKEEAKQFIKGFNEE